MWVDATLEQIGELRVKTTRPGPFQPSDTTHRTAFRAEPGQHVTPQPDEPVLLGRFTQRKLGRLRADHDRRRVLAPIDHDTNVAGRPAPAERKAIQRRWEHQPRIMIGSARVARQQRADRCDPLGPTGDRGDHPRDECRCELVQRFALPGPEREAASRQEWEEVDRERDLPVEEHSGADDTDGERDTLRAGQAEDPAGLGAGTEPIATVPGSEVW